MDRGGRIIETWVESCPHCGHDVAVTSEAAAVTCGACRRTFRWEGREADAAELDTPTRKIEVKRHGPVDPHDSLVGTTLGKWTLTRLIGRGGMGRVYEARGGLMNRKVALKVLSEDLAGDPSFVKRFHREAKLLASLSHPHIVDVLDRGEDAERLWFAMDYVRGESLRKLMDRGPIAADQAARIAIEIASALAYAHGKGVIHRDLKPENVLLDESGSVHLVDFGLSRLVTAEADLASTRLTRTDVILGTYEYMAPEQRRGERKLDGRADVFALGVILYEMLTGSLPLGRFTPPSQHAGVPRAFDEVINAALATLPKDRFQDAGAFQDALRKALEKAPSAGLPPPLPGRALPPVVPSYDIEEARSILRHIEILGAMNRVAGLVLVLGAFGLFSIFTWLFPFPWAVSFGGVIAFIVGLYLLGLGKRIQRLESGARESQVTVGVVMLLFPPFFTALGLYALIVMTSERARKAFRIGRKALREAGARSLPRESIQLSAPTRPEGASFLIRAFCFLAICWSLYAGFLALDLFSGDSVSAVQLDQYRASFHASVVASVFALLTLIRMFLIRNKRRGFGLALIAFLFLWASSAFFSAALETAESPDALRSGAAYRLRPWTHVTRTLHWENSK